MKICSFPKCNKERLAWGLCGAHYYQAKHNGKLKPLRKSPAKSSYGQLKYKGKHRSAHSVSLELASGIAPPKDRSLALHSCRNRHCVNPKHLRWRSISDNAQDRENYFRAMLN